MPKPPLRVLILETGAPRLKRLLDEDGRGRFFTVGAGGLDAALARLREGPLDLAAVELSEGLEPLLAVRGEAPGLPVVALVPSRLEKLGLAAVREGAQDYLVAGAYDGGGLRRVLENAVERKRAADRRLALDRRAAPRRSEDRRRDQELEQKRRHDSLREDALGAFSHELRTPLTVVRGAIEVLRDGAGDRLNPSERSLLELSWVSLERMIRLLENLLDLSRLEGGGPVVRRPVDAAAVARETAAALKLAAGRAEVSVEVEADAAAPQVLGDADLLAQVLGNLLANALRFAKTRVVVRVAGRGAGVQLTVQDDGPGIPPERAGELFNKYAQLCRTSSPGGSYKGTGLGLAVSKRIMERLGGSLWVESRAGGGASFHALLPAHRAA